MALGINTESSGGDFLPIIKYDAKAGRMFRIDKSQAGDGSWISDDVDITDKAVFIADLANVTVGWISFAGGSPDFQMVKLGEALPPRPTDQHKQGFRVRIKLGADCGGDVREFSHTAKAVLQPFDAIHTAYENATEAKEGKLPAIAVKGTTPIKTKTPAGQTTNYAPVFEIVGWHDRPEELGAPPAAAAEQPASQANGAMHAPPPAATQEPVTAQSQF